MAGTIAKMNRSVKQSEKELTTIGFHVKIESDSEGMTQYLIVNQGDVPGITVSDRQSKGKKRAQWAAEVVVTAPTETDRKSVVYGESGARTRGDSRDGWLLDGSRTGAQ